MLYSDQFQETNDIDWFGVDESGNLAHFASAGGKLPATVAESIEDNLMIIDYIKSLPQICETFTVNDNIWIPLGIETSEARRQYLNDFALMAKKGLFSFDKSVLNDFSNKEYHLVTSPISKIDIATFPKEIQSVIKKTVIATSFDNIFGIVF